MSAQELVADGVQLITLPGKPPAMLDRYLAKVYGVSTKRLNQQVSRNQNWFNDKFRFQLTYDEVANCNFKLKGHIPWAYTQDGCTMAAFVLHTETALRAREKVLEIFHAFQDGELVAISSLEPMLEYARMGFMLKKFKYAKKMNPYTLKEMRRYRAMGLTQRETAKLLDVSKYAIQSWEKYDLMFNIENLQNSLSMRLLTV